LRDELFCPAVVASDKTIFTRLFMKALHFTIQATEQKSKSRENYYRARRNSYTHFYAGRHGRQCKSPYTTATAAHCKSTNYF